MAKISNTVKSAVDALKAAGSFIQASDKAAFIKELQDATFLDADLSTLEIGDVIDLTGLKVEDLLEVTGSLTISGSTRPAYFFVADVQSTAGTTDARRIFLGSFRKRVQPVDATLANDGPVQRCATYAKFANLGSQYKILAELAGKKITVKDIRTVWNGVRDAGTRQVTGRTQTNIIDFEIA